MTWALLFLDRQTINYLANAGGLLPTEYPAPTAPTGAENEVAGES